VLDSFVVGGHYSREIGWVASLSSGAHFAFGFPVAYDWLTFILDSLTVDSQP